MTIRTHDQFNTTIYGLATATGPRRGAPRRAHESPGHGRRGLDDETLVDIEGRRRPRAAWPRASSPWPTTSPRLRRDLFPQGQRPGPPRGARGAVPHARLEARRRLDPADQPLTALPAPGSRALGPHQPGRIPGPATRRPRILTRPQVPGRDTSPAPRTAHRRRGAPTSLNRVVQNLLSSRQLLRDFVARDLQARYVGSSLGFFWSIVCRSSTWPSTCSSSSTS